ncbi:hypothetical protein [Levilactobacillus angrenensis]|uniref:Gram-positive cocci surface proteins LPxTG domain-containing protein n=1 Tax=Levilactobacillus angrenensis TaxID=2486020 RepID=A0ABW1UCN8_9LACO|nr:hypothetical protein [Levilactobacillus angrenensis]
MQLLLAFTLMLGLSMTISTLVQADSTGNSKVGITIVNNQVTTIKGHAGDTEMQNIPDGKSPTRSSTSLRTSHDGDTASGQRATGQSQVAPRKTKRSAIHEVATAIATGRLPQTSEVQSLLTNLVGILLLIVLVLAMIVYHQARLLREKG